MYIDRMIVGIIIKDGKCLVLKDKQCKGLYVFPGGDIELELKERYTGLCEQMFEKIGIDVTSAIPITSSIQWYDTIDGIIHAHEMIYLVTGYKGIPYIKDLNKHLEMKWVSYDEVMENPKEYSRLVYEIVCKYL